MARNSRSDRRWAPAAALAVLACAVSASAAPSIAVTGSWSQTIGPANLNAGAGSDLPSVYTSAGNQVLLGLSDPSWRVSVQRVDASWNSNLNLYVQRTSDGSTPNGTIAGGTAYQLVTPSAQSFFTGTKNFTNIAVQVQLTGVSLQVPPAAYSTGLTFTITHI